MCPVDEKPTEGSVVYKFFVVIHHNLFNNPLLTPQTFIDPLYSVIDPQVFVLTNLGMAGL